MALVAHVASYGNPQPSSFIPSLLRLSEALEARGDQLAIITLDIPNATWVRNVRNSVSQLHLVSKPVEVGTTLARIRPAIVHTHFDDFDIPVTTKMFFSDARIFWHDHSLRDPGLISGLKFYLKYLGIGSRVEGFVACSETIASDLHNWGAPAKKVRLVVNGIDLIRFRPPTPEERRAARQEFGLDAEDVLLFFGRDIYIKGVDTFWSALRFLDRPTVMLIGAPSEAQKQIAPIVGRLISIDSTGDVRKLYWAADLLVVASRFESFCQVLVEAVSSSLPAVAGDISAIREISRELNGIHKVAANDARALADGIRKAKRERVERAPQLQKFSLDRWVSEMLSLYYKNG